MEILPISPVFPINPFSERTEVKTYRVTEEEEVRVVAYVYDSDGNLETTRVVTVDVQV